MARNNHQVRLRLHRNHQQQPSSATEAKLLHYNMSTGDHPSGCVVYDSGYYLAQESLFLTISRENFHLPFL